MTDYLNPFYARAAEQQRDALQFVTSFGAGALDMLPEQIWDRFVIIRSSPGAGKTSLMRLFAIENLESAWARLPGEPVHRELIERGAIDADGPRKLGLLVSLDRDYHSLLDLNLPGSEARRLFFRLLDVRILVGVLRAALSLRHLSFPADVNKVSLSVTEGDGRTDALIERLGGPTGEGILSYAKQTERQILDVLNALIASDVENVPVGHNELYSLTILAESSILVDGTALDAQPLIMFDDGHSLHRDQRDFLLDELKRRNTSIARWYAERYEALSDQELLGGIGSEGRDVLSVNLDRIAREGDGRRFHKSQYDRVLTDIARRRAAVVLATYAREHQPFLDLMDDDRGSGLGEKEQLVHDTLRNRVLAIGGVNGRYDEWIASADRLDGLAAAHRWRELEVLIYRDQNRQQDLFNEALTDEEIDARSSSSLREAAALAVANEFNLPHYAGEADIVRLGSHNAHQFLDICGDLFAEMLVDVSLGRPPRLSVARQNRVLRGASERLWESIPRVVPHGRDVQAIVREIVEIAKVENHKPRMPYPPGVTGAAILMAERKLLLDDSYTAGNPAAARLAATLSSALAFNILQAELDYSVKGSRYMVLYLNRLLCPRFGLPLGLGGFKERRLSVMLSWIHKLPAHGPSPSLETGTGVLDL